MWAKMTRPASGSTRLASALCLCSLLTQAQHISDNLFHLRISQGKIGHALLGYPKLYAATFAKGRFAPGAN